MICWGRIEKLCYGLESDYIDATQITLKVISGLYPGVTTVELDNLAVNINNELTCNKEAYILQ